jgi:SAM-dependent methyltransferase
LPGRLQRVLLLDRDGVRLDPAVAVVLRDRGVEVTEAAGSGWLDMVFHPEQYAPPLDVFDRVGAWLAAAPNEPPPAGHGADGPERADAPAVRSTLEIDASGLRETPVEIGASFGRLFGILAEPAVGSTADLAVVFLNAGAVRRIGPNRMWVEAARRWTARGVATLRMDLEGIGDADGDPGRYRDVGNFYTPEMGAAVRAILDDLTERGLGRRVVLVGLCAGGYWAFHTAAEDPRVVGTLIINPRAMIWDPGLLDRREARKVERAIRGSEWRRVVRGEVPPARVLAVGRAVAVSAIRRAAALPATIRSARDEDRSGDPLDEVFGQLAGHGTRVVLAFSGDEPVHDELAADGVLDRLDQWPNVSVVRLPGTDHTVRPLAAQQAVHDLVDRELERICRGDTPRPVAPAAVVSAARSSLGQRRANDRVWTSGRHLGAYANRHLRPVEVVILARYREALSGSVLEIGSGAGRLTGYLAELGGTVLGIDVSTEMVGYSRRRYPDATFETRDLRDIAGLGSATFDAVFAPFNILDVVDDADRRRCLDAIHGVLRADGLFVLSTHNRAVEARLDEPLRLPGRTIPDTVSRLVHRPIWQRNRNRLLPLERREADWAILNDPGHDFTVLHYYIDRDAQERQLAEHGFELIEVLDLQGRVVPRGAVSSSPELHYVARRRPLPRP